MISLFKLIVHWIWKLLKIINNLLYGLKYKITQCYPFKNENTLMILVFIVRFRQINFKNILNKGNSCNSGQKVIIYFRKQKPTAHFRGWKFEKLHWRFLLQKKIDYTLPKMWLYQISYCMNNHILPNEFTCLIR